MRTFGCDVGNGFAYVSTLDSTGKPTCTLPPQWAAGAGMPAEAYVNEDGTIDVASQGAIAHRDPGRIVRAIKRSLAKGTISLTPMGGADPVSVEAAAVYSAIAKRALDASVQTMRDRGDTPPHDVVLTYPASFADSKRLIATMRTAVTNLVADDGERFDVVGSIPEPAAIALDFLHFMRHEVAAARRLDQRDLTVVVYDLGHGTFDTALVTARAVMPGNVERPWDLHDYDGIPDVGGIDFDQVLLDLFRQHFPAPDDASLADGYLQDLLREQAARCKHELSEATSAEVRLLLANGSPVRFTVTRDEFEAASVHLLDQTLAKVSAMFESARRLGVPVTHVVLSGGASRMPMVRRRVQELVGPGVTVTLFRPSEAVSFGAARYANTLTRTKARTMFVDNAATAEQRMDQLFEPLLTPTRTPVPDVPEEPDVPAWGKLIQHVPHPLGLLYSGRHGRVLHVLLPRGADVADSSAVGQLQVRADSSYVELVVARAIDPHTTKGRLQEGDFLEVCHLVCDEATAGTTYDVRIQLCEDGLMRGMLTDDSGHTLRMEMN